MRYLPLTKPDRDAMLKKIGAKSVDDLFIDAPKGTHLKGTIENLPNHFSEMEVERQMVAMASKNIAASSVPFFVGGGVYKHHVPASVDHLIQRGEFLTSYTPYQPEVSQGTLQYLFEFQTQVCLLTGMEVANASMYDGSTATAEAVMMANRVTGRKQAIVSGSLHPHYCAVIQTSAEHTNFDLKITETSPAKLEDLTTLISDQTSCVVVQNPDFFGRLHDFTALAKTCHDKGALLIVVVTEIVSLGLLTPPGEMGADIVVCEGQSIGNPLTFGGPHVGLFATKEKYIRQMPGRICGETVDADGKRGYVLTLSTREQHIRREKATSNICTNSGLCALAFTIHLSMLGENGLRKLAELNHAKTVQLADKLSAAGIEVLNQSFFNEFTVKLKKPANDVVEKLAEQKILGGIPLSRLFPKDKDKENLLLLACTEVVTDEQIDSLVNALKGA